MEPDRKIMVDCFTAQWADTKFPENSYDCTTLEEVSEIIKNCMRPISGIRKVEVWLPEVKEDPVH
jgi:hypothetical protein